MARESLKTGLIFINDPFAYTFVRLLSGAFAHGGVVVGYVWIMEFVGPNSRSWVGAHYLSIFSIGFAFLSLVGYYARDWHDMQIWESLKFFVIFIEFGWPLNNFYCPREILT